jgi:hypothetical protein
MTFYKAKYWTVEINTSKKYTKRCHNGKVSLAPELLKKLLTEIAQKHEITEIISESTILL